MTAAKQTTVKLKAAHKELVPRQAARKDREREAFEKVVDIVIDLYGPALKELEKYQVPNLRYLERSHVDVIVEKLAARLFGGYGDPLPALTLLGGESHGGGLLESALALPRQPYYRSTYDKAAVLFRSLIKNHPFVDGNKRAAAASLIAFLLYNKYLLLAGQAELVQFALAIAESEPDVDWREISRWVRRRTVRTVALRKLPRETADRIRKTNPDLDFDGLRDRLDIMIAVLDEVLSS